jgi:hypothetical protein
MNQPVIDPGARAADQLADLRRGTRAIDDEVEGDLRPVGRTDDQGIGVD